MHRSQTSPVGVRVRSESLAAEATGKTFIFTTHDLRKDHRKMIWASFPAAPSHTWKHRCGTSYRLPVERKNRSWRIQTTYTITRASRSMKQRTQKRHSLHKWPSLNEDVPQAHCQQVDVSDSIGSKRDRLGNQHWSFSKSSH